MSDGVGAGGIRTGLSLRIPSRTLERSLNLLEEDGRIKSSASGKGKRYFPAPKESALYSGNSGSFPPWLRSRRVTALNPAGDGTIHLTKL